MKKVFVSPLQEILDTHVTQVQDYLEDALKMMFSGYLESSSGVIYGLEPTIGTGLNLNIAIGSILMDGVYGEIESPTAVVLTGTSASGLFRDDLIVLSYEEIFDSQSSGYVLLDVVSRAEQIVSLPTRRFGAIKLEQLQDTTYLSRPSNKIPLCQVTVSNTGITSLIDYREYSLINRFKKELELGFSGFFYGSMY
jgi:hypothetical protein